MKEKIIVFLLFVCLVMSNFSSLPVSSSFTDDPITTSTNINGSLLSPEYFYLSEESNQNGRNSGIGLSTNNQPGYLNAYSFIDSNIYSRNTILPPNFQTNNVTNFNQAFGLIDQNDNILGNEAYFVEYGNIQPTLAEKQMLGNYSTPEYEILPLIYPYNDETFYNKTTTTPASLIVTTQSDQVSITPNTWFKFTVSSLLPKKIILESPHDLFSLIIIQNFGQTSIRVHNNGQSLLGYSNTNVYGSSTRILFFNTFEALDNFIQIDLSSCCEGSELFLTVNNINNPATSINLNEVIKENVEKKKSDLVISEDPFKSIQNLNIRQYTFTVPDSLDNTGIQFILNYYSYFGYNYNIYIYSNTGEIASTNSPVLVRKGEIWTIAFLISQEDAYNFYLTIQSTPIPEYIFGSSIGLIVSNCKLYYQVSIDYDGFISYFMEGMWEGINFMVWNASGQTIFNSRYFSANIFRINKGNYTLVFENNASEDPVLLSQFGLQKLVQKTFLSDNTISKRNPLLFKVDNFNSRTPYQFNMTTESKFNQSSVQVQIFSADNLNLLYYNYFTLYNNISQDILSYYYSTYIGTVFILITLLTLPQTFNSITLAVNLVNSLNQLNSKQISNIVYSTPGELTLKTNDSQDLWVWLFFNQLQLFTWHKLQLELTNISITGQMLLIMSNLIHPFEYISNMPSYYSKIFVNNTFIQGFGFGALQATASLLLKIHKTNPSSTAKLSVSIKSMATKEIKIANQNIGSIIDGSIPEFVVTGLGGNRTTFGFEILSLMLVFPIILMVRRKFK